MRQSTKEKAHSLPRSICIALTHKFWKYFLFWGIYAKLHNTALTWPNRSKKKSLSGKKIFFRQKRIFFCWKNKFFCDILFPWKNISFTQIYYCFVAVKKKNFYTILCIKCIFSFMCLGYKIHFKNWTILKRGRMRKKVFTHCWLYFKHR